MKFKTFIVVFLWAILVNSEFIQSEMAIVGGVSDQLTQEELFNKGVLPFLFKNLATSEFKVN